MSTENQNNLQIQVERSVRENILQRLAQVDLKQIINEQVRQILKDLIKETPSPAGFQISGDWIAGGIIKNFGSTGIQDLATKCQVTIMDEATVSENRFIAPEVEVKGNLTVDGDIILRGEIPTDSPFYKDLIEHSAGLLKLSMDGQFFLQYADKVFEKIKTHGLDLDKITSNGNTILSGNQLGNFITDSNIQRIGHLKELTVIGNTSLYDTLVVNSKRVGINTEEPEGALAVCDEECEVVIRKYRKNISFIGTAKPQQIILSSNSKNNLVLEPDGSISVQNMSIGAVNLSSSATQPTYDAPRGSIVFNEDPEIGKPLGWVSLGGARWALFGMIS